MNFSNSKTTCRGQAAMEYLMILAVVAIIVLASFRFLVPRVHNSSEDYYNTVTNVILGNKPQPINGGWCTVECPTIQGHGNPVMHRTCECPAPAFGGSYCAGTDVVQCAHETVPSSCTPDGSCSAVTPLCGQVTVGQDNCGGACTKRGPSCPH